jgi:hypothetical protein
VFGIISVKPRWVGERGSWVAKVGSKRGSATRGSAFISVNAHRRISRAVWNTIQNMRCFNDKGFVRWPPHVNLLYPFWEDIDEDTFQEAANRAAYALRNTQSFQVPP